METLYNSVMHPCIKLDRKEVQTEESTLSKITIAIHSQTIFNYSVLSTRVDSDVFS